MAKSTLINQIENSASNGVKALTGNHLYWSLKVFRSAKKCLFSHYADRHFGDTVSSRKVGFAAVERSTGAVLSKQVAEAGEVLKAKRNFL